MKFSLKWLADFIEVKEFFKEPENLVKTLTQAGLEVDSFEDQKAQFKNVVVAQIESVEKHPQADRLTFCKVSTGENSYSIVCGAKNQKAGDKVVLARPGAILPGNFVIKKSRIRGIDSEGMLASRTELGFEQKDKEEGIWILAKEAKVGLDFSKQLGLEDIIFEIEVPPNRSDCLSHKGLAREISCLFSLPFSAKEYSIKGDDSLSVQKSFKVEVKDKKSCPRYCGCLIEGVKIGESPTWLKERLQSLGLKSINNVVDITNFVLKDRGQPLHAFDRDKIQTLIVDRSQEDEKFLALDETEIVLTGEELTIRDEDRVLALAGVIGGMDTSITQETKNIFIESAYFAPEKVRRTSRRFGLETDSSYCFARAVDLTAVREAMDLACFLIQKEAGGKISKDFYDIYEKQKSPENIKISLEDLESRLGYEVLSSEFQDWMTRLGCEVQTLGQKNVFEVLAPSYRPDLKIKEDLIEEFARLEGYDKVPEKFVSVSGLPKDFEAHFLNSQKLISFLSGKGWYQAINYSFGDPDFYKDFLNGKYYLENLLEEENLEDNLLQEKQAIPNKTEIYEAREEVENLREDEKNIKANLEGRKKSADDDYRIYKQTGSKKYYEKAIKKYEEVKNMENELNNLKQEKKNTEEEWNRLKLKENQNKEEKQRANNKQVFSVDNPISQQLSLMKPLLAPDLVKNIVSNFRHNNKFGQIFELSPVFYKEDESYKQDTHLGMALWGSPVDIWKSKRTPNVYYIKSVLESLFEAFRIKGFLWKSAKISFLHPKQSLLLSFQNKVVGFLGSLHPQLLQKYKIPLDVALAEFHWDTLKQAGKKPLKFKSFSNLLTVEKDISFVIPSSISVEEVKREMKKSLGSLCDHIEVFDVYEKQGERSVSFRMYLTPEEKSWTDEQFQVFFNKVIENVHKKFSIKLK